MIIIKRTKRIPNGCYTTSMPILFLPNGYWILTFLSMCLNSSVSPTFMPSMCLDMTPCSYTGACRLHVTAQQCVRIEREQDTPPFFCKRNERTFDNDFKLADHFVGGDRGVGPDHWVSISISTSPHQNTRACRQTKRLLRIWHQYDKYVV